MLETRGKQRGYEDAIVLLMHMAETGTGRDVNVE